MIYRTLVFILALTAGLQVAAQDRIEIEQPVVLEGDTVYGSLLSQYPLSERKMKKQPLLIIVPGSGPTDRDGNSALSPGKNNAYQQLADSLLVSGIASFRYDKPGIGKSKLSKGEDQLKFEDNVSVISAIVQKMENLGFKDIIIAGHSEGSLSGMLAAQHNDVEAYISMAGMGTNMKEVILGQLEKQLGDSLMTETRADMDSIQMGETVKDFHPMLFSLLRPSVQPYLFSAFQYNPAEEIKELEIPVMIIQGGNDLQVTEEEGKKLKEANSEAQYYFYPEMNHVLKTTDGSAKQNHAAYMDPDFPLHQQMLVDLRDFILDATD